MILAKYVEEALINHIETASEIKCNGERMLGPQGFRQTMLANIKLCREAGFRMFLALKLEFGRAVPCIVLGYAPKTFSTKDNVQKLIADVLSGENSKHEKKAYIFYQDNIVSGDPEKFGEIIPFGTSFPVLSRKVTNAEKTFLYNDLGKVVFTAVEAEATRRNIDIEGAYDDMLRVPDEHLGEDYRQYSNPSYWRGRMELVASVRAEGEADVKLVNDKLSALRTLIASRIQRDGSKTMFKAKHLVDLPGDFAERLVELLEIGKE